MRLKLLVMLQVMLLMSSLNPAAANEMFPYQVKAELFLNRLVKNNLDEAYKLIVDGTTLTESKANRASFRKKAAEIRKTYGKPLSYEFYKQEKISPERIKVQYLLKNEKFPLIWEFYFVKNKDEWLIGKINFK